MKLDRHRRKGIQRRLHRDATVLWHVLARASVGGTIKQPIDVMFKIIEQRAIESFLMLVYKNVGEKGVAINVSDERQLICEEAAVSWNHCVAEDPVQFLIDALTRNDSKLSSEKSNRFDDHCHNYGL